MKRYSIARSVQTWKNSEDWRERTITFDPSWFVVTMGTGIIVQLLNNFPYPAQWLHDLAYCFWILDIVLFTFFTFMSLLRLVRYPKVALNVFADFTQTSYLGAIPVAFDSIVVGIVIFYADHQTGIWVAFAFFWTAVGLTALVVLSSVFVVYHHQKDIELSDVTGVWLLTFIPMVVIGATGSSLVPHLPRTSGVVVLTVSFMLWALGVSMSFVVATIYFWRLIKCQLPARDAIISCFVPVGPFGMGAYAIQNLAVGLATHIEKYHFTLARGPSVPSSSLAVVAESIHWVGIILAFASLGFASFWLVEAIASVWSKFPRSFNIGFWSFIFPIGVYANAWCQLSKDLRNSGIAGFASTCVVATILLWLACTLATIEGAVLRGKLFYAPGLQGWKEKEYIEKRRTNSAERYRDGHALGDGSDEYDGHLVSVNSGSDGTYAYSRRTVSSQRASGRHATIQPTATP